MQWRTIAHESFQPPNAVHPTSSPPQAYTNPGARCALQVRIPQTVCNRCAKPLPSLTLPHLQPPRVIETHSASFQQTAGWGQTYPPHSVFERSHLECASQPFHSTYAGWFLPSHLISSRPLYRFPSAHLTNSSHHAREVSVLMSYRRGERHRDKVARRIRTSRAPNYSSR